MSEAIPGPDPGACPDCGGWRKAGMRHDCEETRAWLDELTGDMLAALRSLEDEEARS